MAKYSPNTSVRAARLAHHMLFRGRPPLPSGWDGRPGASSASMPQLERRRGPAKWRSATAPAAASTSTLCFVVQRSQGAPPRRASVACTSAFAQRQSPRRLRARSLLPARGRRSAWIRTVPGLLGPANYFHFFTRPKRRLDGKQMSRRGLLLLTTGRQADCHVIELNRHGDQMLVSRSGARRALRLQ